MDIKYNYDNEYQTIRISDINMEADGNIVNERGLTITQKYQDEESFTAMMERIGVSGRAIGKLVDDDFISMQALVTNYANDVDSFTSYLKGLNKTFGGTSRSTAIRFSPIAIKRLSAVLFHFVLSVGCIHTVPDIDNVDILMCIHFIQVHDTFKNRKGAEGEDEAMIELPELKGHINWTTYRDKFVSNLLNMIGTRSIPLSYVIDDTDRPQVTRTTPLIETDAIDLLDDSFFARYATHHGALYSEDNSKVWMLIKKSLLGHQPYHHVDEFENKRDGRGAWLTLKAYYEGEDFVNKTIQENLTKLRTLHYRGETQRFGFEQFVDIQKECYKRLRDVGYNNGLGVDEATKCSNLKTMILGDAQLETALSIARTRGLFNGNFDDLVHFLKAEVDELILRKKQLRSVTTRGGRISAVMTNGSGGGRGRGRGGRGRGGRGRGRGRGRGNRKPRTYLTKVVQGKEVSNGNYSSADFAELTREQKETVKQLQRQGEAMAAANTDTMTIQSLVTQAVNEKLEAAVVCGVANATNEGNDYSPMTQTAETAIDGSDHSTIQSVGSKRRAQSGNVGNFLSNKKLQISFKPNK